MYHILTDRIHCDDIQIDDILTFDDGHYSVYTNSHYLDKYSNRKIIFVTPNFIGSSSRKDRIYFPKHPQEYMYDFFVNGKRDQFMTIDELQHLVSEKNFEIGMHSFHHNVVYEFKYQKCVTDTWKTYNIPEKYKKMMHPVSALSSQGVVIENGNIRKRTLEEYMQYVREDAEKCTEWFRKYFGHIPNIYAFPFNEHSEFLKSVLATYGVAHFFGEERKEGS